MSPMTEGIRGAGEAMAMTSSPPVEIWLAPARVGQDSSELLVNKKGSNTANLGGVARVSDRAFGHGG